MTSLYLYENNFTGDLPVSIFNLPNVVRIKLSHNQLSGIIPNEICNVEKVYLNHNNFYGLIPPCVCEMTKIEIYNNWLCEEYPDCLDEEAIGVQNPTECSK